MLKLVEKNNRRILQIQFICTTKRFNIRTILMIGKSYTVEASTAIVIENQKIT
jgi:hypothetical protein